MKENEPQNGSSISTVTLLELLKQRFEKNRNRHPSCTWTSIERALQANTNLFQTVQKMEETGGEPDVIEIGAHNYFVDCAPETPAGRRNLCYDKVAMDARKNYKPKSSAWQMAEEMGIELLTESEYLALQLFGAFDTKTSSWLATPVEVRNLGGAIFGDRRYNRVFIYHNGADSYYGSRGFRGKVTIV